MPEEMHELEVRGREHAIAHARIADTVDALRRYLTHAAGVRDNKFRIQRLGEHHYLLTADNDRLIEHLRDMLIRVYRILYHGESRTVRQRQAAVSV